MSTDRPESTARGLDAAGPERDCVRGQVRPGVYADSVVLMRLQSALNQLPGIEEVGVVMATEANLELLRQASLLPEALAAAGRDDLLVVVRAKSDQRAADALGRVDELLSRVGPVRSGEFRPRSLSSAARLLPEAGWVLISVAGRWAARLAREALELGRHVFLFSDNVALADELELKTRARDAGLLVMGPDCGSALVGGVGFGFSNRVRAGSVGLVAASGSGLQAVASRVHALGGGISLGVGTGGRDLTEQVGGVTSRQALQLLGRDPETAVIVLISKPPAAAVAPLVLATARAVRKPVVVCFLGWSPPARRIDNLSFASTLSEAAELATAAAGWGPTEVSDRAVTEPAPSGSRYVRGLFGGGTLAQEAQLLLRTFLHPLWSNGPVDGVRGLPATAASREHTILDLGADELTAGRLHPMLDQELLLRLLAREAEDAEVGMILLDVILGDGSHPDPAARLGPAIEAARRRPGLEVAVILVGTEEDPQGLESQRDTLRRAGARVYGDLEEACGDLLRQLAAPPAATAPVVDPATLARPVAAINVGLETFYRSLLAQGARAVQLDWRPPAGGDRRLTAILDKMRGS